jgi:hypothetical protein
VPPRTADGKRRTTQSSGRDPGGHILAPRGGRGSFTPTGLGKGAGADDTAAVAAFRRALARAGICPRDQACGVNVAQRPVDVLNYSRIQATPLALATVLALLAMATVAHLLLTSIAIANAVAVAPGLVAGRLRPATVLRDE